MYISALPAPKFVNETLNSLWHSHTLILTFIFSSSLVWQTKLHKIPVNNQALSGSGHLLSPLPQAPAMNHHSCIISPTPMFIGQLFQRSVSQTPTLQFYIINVM